MHFVIDEKENCHIVRLRGHLGAIFVNQTRHQLLEVVKQRGRTVLLDLKDVDFIDSSGLGLVVALLKNSRENGGNLILCNLADQAQSLFELTKLNKVLSIFATENEAVSRAAKS
jgi:anti-anti-sigma factor